MGADTSSVDTESLRVLNNLLEFCPHDPTDKQAELIADDRLELFYGGAAGGGKSDGLLMAATKFVHVRGYEALIVRRTFSDLNKSGAIMDRAVSWFTRAGVAWDKGDHRFTFPSGARLSFGHLDHSNAHLHYQGGEWQCIGVDELPQFQEPQYLYLFSRLRKLATSPLPIRMRGAGNPGGPGHDWCKRRFIDERTREHSARFIPAGIADNPHLNTEYAASLDKLDAVTRAQLKHGDWDVTASGNTFKRQWWGFVDSLPVGARAGVRRWDLAATEPRPGYSDPDFLSSCRMTEHEGVTYVVHATRDRVGPSAGLKIMADTAAMDGRAVRQRAEREPGSSGVIVADHLARTVFRGYDFQAIPSTGDKLTRSRPLSAAAEQGKVLIVKGDWNQWWIDSMATFPTKGIHDDDADAASGCFADVHQPTVSSAPVTTSSQRRITSELHTRRGGLFR